MHPNAAGHKTIEAFISKYLVPTVATSAPTGNVTLIDLGSILKDVALGTTYGNLSADVVLPETATTNPGGTVRLFVEPQPRGAYEDWLLRDPPVTKSRGRLFSRTALTTIRRARFSNSGRYYSAPPPR